ncbi:MAG TPA: multiheme c-type cytochrome [Kofleriaceae bacterium]|jgi:tetratricopeptide (TPR) repeat protein
MRGALLAVMVGATAAVVAVVSCAGDAEPPDARAAVAPAPPAPPAPTAARIPRAPGEFGPSFVAIDHALDPKTHEVSTGDYLADVDSCSTCHPDAAAQWATSAHSFASFGNPIYRENVEFARHDLGKRASQHCGGCHDMPLVVDHLMDGSSGEPPPLDLRSHTGVSCRLCHGIEKVTQDGNGSYVWSPAPIEAPDLQDPASIARHKAQVSPKALGTEMCVGCHRGFLSPDMDMPVHVSGIDEPGSWRYSAWTGNGMARVDTVEQRTCIDCHMTREPASAGELGAKGGTFASHRFIGANTWMAAMRGDTEHMKLTQAKLVGVASIDITGARVEGAGHQMQWVLPADGAPIAPGTRIELDVVIRNLLAGHRFPGGVLDVQDTWIEVELADARGTRLAQSGLAHERDAADTDAHVLRSFVVGDDGKVLEEHQLPSFRSPVSTQTLAAREAQAIRYAFDIPKSLSPAQLPLTVTARLRHRSRTLAFQAVVCKSARTPLGARFLAGAKGARDVTLDPCATQPVTLIAETHVQLGADAERSALRASWERLYEHGMALTSTVTERLDESRVVLETALPLAPAGKPRAMVLVQLAVVADKQGRVDDALALIAEARALLPSPGPAALDAIASDALARVWRWKDAIAPARACTERAPDNAAAWIAYARILASAGDDEGALAAATRGLALSPRDPDLLRSQATALAALHRPEAAAALAAYDRFRSPDAGAQLRITCASSSPRCARERESGHTHLLHL